ncbi:unnamed protein product, partial [Brassica rapa subsp. trilocularis]
LKIVEINSEANQREELSKWFIKYLNRQGDWLEKTRGNLMVAATVIAGMSFQVMVNPPSGVWQSDICSPGHQTGVCKAKVWGAIVQTSKRGFYHGMVTSTTVSFSASMTQILLIISGLRLSYLMEPFDNGDSGYVHDSSSSLYIGGILLCGFGSIRR